jgi:prevent-host-death family protein
MAIEVGAFEAKTHLSRLLAAVERGERVTITRRGKPIAVLVAPEAVRQEAVSQTVAELTALRGRTRGGPESLVDLRDAGRR